LLHALHLPHQRGLDIVGSFPGVIRDVIRGVICGVILIAWRLMLTHAQTSYGQDAMA